MCCDDHFSKCSSKICKNYLLTTLDESVESNKCESYETATFVLENRYLVNSVTCKDLGREIMNAKSCVAKNEVYMDFIPNSNHNCKHSVDQGNSSRINGIEDFYKLTKLPSFLSKLEILNLNGEIQFNDTFSYLKRIETCLIIRNSSAFVNLQMFNSLQSICKGCEWKGSTYKVIIENNENLESLWNPTSKLNTAEGKIYLKGNPKLRDLKDTNGIFKCNFPEISIEIIANKNSALIMTDFDVTTSLSYNLTCEDCDKSFASKVMDKNFDEILELNSWHEYVIQFEINGTQKTDFCSFKTLKSDKIIDDIDIKANFTEIILNWTTARDVDFLKNEGFGYYIAFRNVSKGKNGFL